MLPMKKKDLTRKREETTIALLKRLGSLKAKNEEQ